MEEIYLDYKVKTMKDTNTKIKVEVAEKNELITADYIDFSPFDEIFDLCINMANNKNALKDTLFKNNISSRSPYRFNGINPLNEGLSQKSTTILDLYNEFFQTTTIKLENWIFFKKFFNIRFNGRDDEIYALKNRKSLESYEFDNPLRSSLDYLKNTVKEDAVKNFAEKAKELTNNFKDLNVNIIKTTTVNTSADLLIFIIDHTFANNDKALIKKCANCSNYFVTKKSDTKYCDRPSPQYPDKSCKNAADLILKNKKATQDEVYSTYKKIYNLYRNKVNLISEVDKYQVMEEEFENFKENNISWKEKFKDGKVTKEEYLEWLRSHYKTPEKRREKW